MAESNNLITKCGKEVLKEERISLIREIISSRMTESLAMAPQATIAAKADMSALIALREEYLTKGTKLTYTDLFLKISSLALAIHPDINVSIEDGKLIQYKSINIGMAVGTDDALYVPVIKDVKDKSLLDIAKETKDFIEKINGNRILPEEMSGGTFTISNMGMFRVDVMTPIINTPESAILAIGATRKEAVVADDDTIRIKPMTTLSLTIDHRALDGLPAARFLETLLEIIENPKKYLRE